MEISTADAAAAATSPVDGGPPSQTDEEMAEVAALRRDNAELKVKLDDLQRARAAGPAALVESSESTIAGGLDGEVGSEQSSGNSGTKAMSVGSERRSWAKGSGGNVDRKAKSSSSGTVPGTDPETVVETIPDAPPATVSRTLLGTIPGTVSGTVTTSVPVIDEGGVIDAVVTANSGDDREESSNPNLNLKSSRLKEKRSFYELGISRMMEGLRADNGRLMKRVKEAEAQTRGEWVGGDTSLVLTLMFVRNDAFGVCEFGKILRELSFR